MAIKFTPTELSEVVLVEPDVFQDGRGSFMELYHQEKYRQGGISADFVQDNRSVSKRGVLRGLHYQLKRPQAKLVSVLAGEIFDVAVDIRVGSPTFRKWVGYSLSAENRRQLFIPGGFAHGFLALSETAEVLYKCSALYDPADDRGILWSDGELGIAWPGVIGPISEKDGALPTFSKAKSLGVLPVFR